MGVNRLDMKQKNEQMVLQTLRTMHTSTIKQLAQLTGLSLVTVGNIVNAYVESGEVLLGDMHSATGGRPSQAFTYNMSFAHVLALSAQVRKGSFVIDSSVGDLYGEVVWHAEDTFESIDLSSFEQTIETALQLYPRISTVSVSLPGVERDGIILENDFESLKDTSFVDHFQTRYERPFLVENDVNAAVLGYAKKLEDESAIVGIYFPQAFGPGAGIVIDGKVHRGAAGYAGEVNLIPLDVNWLTLNYQSPEETGAAIAKLIGVFCATVNPSQVVVYGDFVTDTLKQAVEQSIPSAELRRIFPRIEVYENVGEDIRTGLFSLALDAYNKNI